MKKEEIIALGVPENRVRDFQKLYTRDVKKMAMAAPGKCGPIREAIISMLKMVQDVDALREILDLVTRLYCSPKTRKVDKE